MDLVAFDLETNGFSPDKHSVLSISAQRMRVIDDVLEIVPKSRFARYYFPKEGEQYNEKAIAVNGLHEGVIALRRRHGLTVKDYNQRLREGLLYPQVFTEDNYFERYAKDCVVVAHNINFDSKFLEFKSDKYCTMVENAGVLMLPSTNSHSEYKWPSLKETAEYYKIEVDTSKQHESSYDVLLLGEVLKAMYRNRVPSLLRVLGVEDVCFA